MTTGINSLCARIPANGGDEGDAIMAISKELLEILACPQCKGEITLTAAEDVFPDRAQSAGVPSGPGFVCRTCKLFYRIEDDIPIMLIDEARRIE
jgi:uncharacterized protein YbaR (Trm112 family)